MTDKPTYEELEQRILELEKADLERKRVQEGLLEKERRVRFLFDGIPVALYRTAEDGRILEANPALADMLEFPDPQSLLFLDSAQFLVRPEEQIKQRNILKQDGVLHGYEVEFRRRDGSTFWVRDSARVFHGPDGQAFYEGSLEDITERKKVEEALRKSEATVRKKLQSILEPEHSIGKLDLADIIDYQALQTMMEDFYRLTHIGSAVVDLSGKVLVATGWQDVCTKFHRINPETLKNCLESDIYLSREVPVGNFKAYRCKNNLWDMATPIVVGGRHVGNIFLGQFFYEDEVPNYELFRSQARRYGFDEVEYLAAIDRVPRWSRETVELTMTFYAKLAGMISTLSYNTLNLSRALSQQEITLQRLGESEARYSTFINSTSDFVFLKDERFRYIVANKPLADFLGKHPDAVIGLSDFELMPPEMAANCRASDKNAINEGSVSILEEPVGDSMFETIKFPVPLQNGKAGVGGFIRDITDRKRAEENKKKLEAQLQQAQKMESIGTLAGGIAHDFNNILSIIVGNTELAMVDVPEWSPAQDNLKEAREATLRARELVKQILLFARQKEHTVSNIHLQPIAQESLKMLRASIPTTVEIHENIEEGLPPVLADPSQIQQIIMNLCTNAGQVMEAEGGILTFTLDTTDRETPLHTMMESLPSGRYVRIQVNDTGPGIPPENLEKIFDPFFTTKGVGEGTGLGLAVVHGIVQDRNGGITVESEEGLGTTFTIYLPASDVASAEATLEQKYELPRGTERILFVDDEAMILRLGQRLLERLGYEVETRASGTDALECFRQDPHRFDLVVTDMTMPGMRGDRLAEEILVIRPDIPVILSTGYSKQISKEKAHEMGIRAFVMKPLTQHELAITVRRVLDEKPHN